MNINYLVKSLVLLALGLFTTAGYAAGQATSISAPRSAVQGASVTIMVNGKGTCGSTITFGDGGSGTKSNAKFPHRYRHTYRLARTYTINFNSIRGKSCTVSRVLPGRKIVIISARAARAGKPLIRGARTNNQVPRRSVPRQVTRQRIGVSPVVPRPTCGGRTVTIFGTPRNDVIMGTPGNDVIHGLGGNDTIRGGGGNDTICGGDGNDLLYGMSGNNRLYGGNGRDRLQSGSGNDWLFGGPGNDLLHSGSGNDKLFGGNGNDTVYGGFGRDYLFGGHDNDRLNGGSGLDVCDGGSGTDSTDGTCETQGSIP